MKLNEFEEMFWNEWNYQHEEEGPHFGVTLELNNTLIRVWADINGGSRKDCTFFVLDPSDEEHILLCEEVEYISSTENFFDNVDRVVEKVFYFINSMEEVK